MKRYEVLNPMGFSLPVGARIKMPEDQAKVRKHVVKRYENSEDVYMAVLPCPFVCGQVFETDHDLFADIRARRVKYEGAEVNPTSPNSNSSPGGASSQGSGSDEAQGEGQDSDEDDPPMDYSAMLVEALRDEATRRGLSFHHMTGKEKMIALLLEDDESKADEIEE